MRIKIKLKIQSISDIITNSSSELFCAVHTDDYELLFTIKNVLSGIIDDYSNDTKVRISNTIYDRESGDDVECQPYVEFMIGHGINFCKEFMQTAVTKWLDHKIGENNYIIDFYE